MRGNDDIIIILVTAQEMLLTNVPSSLLKKSFPMVLLASRWLRMPSQR